MGFFGTKGDEPTGNEPLKKAKINDFSNFSVIIGVVVIVIAIIVRLFF